MEYYSFIYIFIELKLNYNTCSKQTLFKNNSFFSNFYVCFSKKLYFFLYINMLLRISTQRQNNLLCNSVYYNELN